MKLGLAFAEGLAWAESSDSLVISAVQGGMVYRLDAFSELHEVADVGGGANNVALASDGSIIVAQNGGTDAQEPLSRIFPDIRLPPVRTSQTGLQCIAPDGQVSFLLSEGLNAPNDVTAHPDGSLYITDPGTPGQPEDYTGGRIMRLSPRGELSEIAGGFYYPNGLQVDGDGNVFVTEGRGLLRINPQGEESWIVEQLTDHGGDGHCLDIEGRHYVAMMLKSGVQVFDRSGRELNFIEFPDGRLTTNCCFGGPDLSWLFMTDGATGHIAVVKDMPTRGARLPLVQRGA